MATDWGRGLTWAIDRQGAWLDMGYRQGAWPGMG